MTKGSRKALAKAFLSLLETKDKKSAVRALAATLVTERRVRDIDFLVQDMSKELFASTGQLHTTVAVAHELSEKTKKSIILFLRQRTGATSVHADFMVDPSLHGGFVARTPVGEINASVSHLLSTLK